MAGSLRGRQSVIFPSGAEVIFGGKDADGNFVADESNLCIAVPPGPLIDRHRRPRSWVTRIRRPPIEKIRFTNIHYFAAGATLFGNEVKGAYQYEGKEYVGQNVTHPLNKCKDCHDVHALRGQAGSLRRLPQRRFRSEGSEDLPHGHRPTTMAMAT